MTDTIQLFELAIAASIIADGPSAFARARSQMAADDFADPRARGVFAAAQSLADDGGSLDALSLSARADVLGVAEVFGGLPGIEAIAREHHRPGDTETAISKVAAAAGLRKTGARMRKLADYAQHPEALENPDRYHAAVAAISAQSRTRLRRTTVGSKAAVGMYMQALVERGRCVAASPSGVSSVDTILGGGFQRKRLYVVGARPGVGKSAFAVQSMYNGARNGHPQIMFSRETPVEDLVGRGVCQIGNLDSERIQRGRGPGGMTEMDMRAVIAAANKIQAWPVEIECDTREMGSVLAQARVWLDTVARPMLEAAMAEDPDGVNRLVPTVWLDYLQRFTVDGKFNSREERVGAMTDMLASFARDEDCAIGLLSQVNRSSAKEVRPPTTADLRESGSIEQDANVVILLHRDAGAPKDDEEDEHAGRVVEQDAMIIVDKNRHGSPGLARVLWRGPSGKYVDRPAGYHME